MGGPWIRVKRFRFFQANFRKKSISLRQIYKKFYFPGKNFRMTFFVYPDKIGHSQPLLCKLVDSRYFTVFLNIVSVSLSVFLNIAISIMSVDLGYWLIDPPRSIVMAPHKKTK